MSWLVVVALAVRSVVATEPAHEREVEVEVQRPSAPRAPDRDPAIVAAELFADGRYAEAAAAFEAAYRETGDPAFLFGHAQALRFGGNCGGAIELFEAFIETGPPEPDVAEARRVIAACREILDQGPTPDPVVTTPQPEPEPEPPRWQPRPEDPTTAEHPLEFPEALGSFYAQLARVDDGEATIARVVHLGASMIGMDDLTGVLRGRFQERFGDGGAGLVLLARFMTNYMHRSVKLRGSGWDHCYIGYLCRKDGFYGLGGVAFFAQPGAKTTITTHEGDAVSRIEVWYAAQRGGGKLAVSVDDGEAEILDARADALEDRFHAMEVERGPHEVEVRPSGHGPVRAYGVVLENDGPGVVWDQFSWLGAFTRRMLAWDEAHIAGQVAHRDPHLIAFTYGGNDLRRVISGKLSGERYVQEYVESIERVRAGKPEASCLVIGITDRSRTRALTVLEDHMQTIVDAQRETARQAGCAFFDSYAAMGGPGSSRKWRKMDPPLSAGDLKHLTHEGRVVLGGWIYDAIMVEYARWRTTAR